MGGVRGRRGPPPLVLALLVLLGGGPIGQTHCGCPGGCDCDPESALCRGGAGLPRGLPPRLATLSLVRRHIEVLGEGSFRDTPALQLLLITAGHLGTIGDGAFSGLVLLEYLFIEDNDVGSIAPTALRGLRGLLYLSLANNRLETLPKGLFQGLETLTQLVTIPTEPGRCHGPPQHQGTPLEQLQPRDFQCLSSGTAPVACHPLPLGGSLVLVMAQLSGGSSVWRRSGGPGSRFVRLQALGGGRLRRPHAVASARLGGHWYLGVADSSKGGTSTLFRWGGRGFYPHQALRPWHRDTHLEFLELGGSPALVLCSGTRRPLVYRWSGGAFAPHTDIPHVPDVYAAKHFRLRGHVFLCLTRFLGDAKVMRWEGSMFREVQQVPARGSMVFQPLAVGGQRYVLLGNDYAPSRVYRLGPGGHLEPIQELLAPSPRSFAPISVGHRHFLVVSSFKGATQIYRHVTIDLGA
ncbi:leucine-rich glioma-inactivated protein 1-like isoform X4 [Pezoporus flaviventris]|uniref:leucine-rich glioma-inactivated protein 1-like isoform X4 n=1 Tax=Pezoporus flaviventris TaxID=889875 RepID=UPI002AB00C80|nr:leucine-rich glioma-inactivated protein 1-like isoform X4 [Pezoporus flaviventris]